MSVMRESGERMVLPRVGRDDFWTLVHEQYAGERPERWKALAILALRENGGWPLEMIGSVFGHHRGHVSRILAKVKRDLRESLRQSPEWLRMGDPEEFDELHEDGFSDPDRQVGCGRCRNAH